MPRDDQADWPQPLHDMTPGDHRPPDQVYALTNQAMARAWSDLAFKQRLQDDPHAATAELGGAWPEGWQVVFVDRPDEPAGKWTGDHEGTNLRLRIPPPPDDSQLSQEQLEGVVGGSMCYSMCYGPPRVC